jgi:hypothetical protein
MFISAFSLSFYFIRLGIAPNFALVANCFESRNRIPGLRCSRPRITTAMILSVAVPHAAICRPLAELSLARFAHLTYANLNLAGSAFAKVCRLVVSVALLGVELSIEVSDPDEARRAAGPLV